MINSDVNFSLFCFFVIPKNNAFIANLFAFPSLFLSPYIYSG